LGSAELASEKGNKILVAGRGYKGKKTRRKGGSETISRGLKEREVYPQEGGQDNERERVISNVKRKKKKTLEIA